MIQEALFDSKTHADNGSIKLSFWKKGTPELAKEYLEALRKTLDSGEVAVQAFEEGRVMYAPPRPEKGKNGKSLGKAALYEMLMETSQDKDTCPRMHIHPEGERLLSIFPVSPFRIFTLEPFEITKNLEPYLTHLPTTFDPVSGRLVHGVEIKPGIEFTVQIPVATTHRFLGDAAAKSIHPDELAEMQVLHLEGGSMQGQTAYPTSAMPTGSECQIPSIVGKAIEQLGLWRVKHETSLSKPVTRVTHSGEVLATVSLKPDPRGHLTSGY